MNAFLVMASIVHCYVGCNTGSEDRQALHVLECDTETGAAKIVQSVKGVQGTTYFAFDRAGDYLYSMTGEKRDTRSVGSIVRFKMDGWRIGAMERLTDLPCETPCHLALAPDFSLVTTAAYLGRTACACDLSGKGLQSVLLANDGVGPRADRQKQAYAHCTFYTPDGRLLGVIDLGCDRIHFYDVAALKAGQGFKCLFQLKSDPGDGPRHAVFSKDGRFLFVVNELSSTVTSYRWDGARSERMSKLPMLSKPYDPVSTKAAAIKLTDDGKILMASNRGEDSIAFFDVKDDGSLALRNVAKLTGKFPRDFELMPGEKFMVVGHKMSNEIRIYRFDRGACTLTPVGEPIPAWRPLCFKFGK